MTAKKAATKKATKRAKKSPHVTDTAANVLGGLAGVAAAAGVTSPVVPAVAALAAFLHGLDPATVEAIDGIVRAKDSHAFLMHDTDENRARAAAYGFGGE